MLKRKPEDNLKEYIKIQKVKYMSAVTCILTVQEKNREQLVSLHKATCFMLANIKNSFRINTVKEVIAHPGGISRYNKRFHCFSHYAVT